LETLVGQHHPADFDALVICTNATATQAVAVTLHQWFTQTQQKIMVIIPTQQVANIRRELWRKLVINNGVNPLSALTGLDTHTLSHYPRFGPLVHQLIQEAANVAAADDELLTGQDADEMFELIRTFDPIKTSMLVDLEKGRQLEVDAISGAVIRRGKQLGMTVPYTETVYALLKHQLGEDE
jgi:2-dehydropantoate 2-reductase